MELIMTTKTKTEQLVNALLYETNEGKITWCVIEPPRSLTDETEQSVPLFLKTEYKGKCIGVYDLRSKYFYDEHQFYWTENIGLCIIDSQGRVIWEANSYFPKLLDLFNLAREKASGLDDILGDIIDDLI